MPRLINADKLRKDVLDLPNCYNGFSDTYDKAMIIDLVDEQPTVEAIPIEWINQWCNRSENTYSKADVAEMLNDWEKENGK